MLSHLISSVVFEPSKGMSNNIEPGSLVCLGFSEIWLFWEEFLYRSVKSKWGFTGLSGVW